MAPFNAKDLQAFMAIAEELSFRKAAERVFIDQSALSRRIQNLEDGLGYQLIFRTTREVVLTEAGRVFYEEIAPAMQALARAGEVARVAAEGKSGPPAPRLHVLCRTRRHALLQFGTSPPPSRTWRSNSAISAPRRRSWRSRAATSMQASCWARSRTRSSTR